MDEREIRRNLVIELGITHNYYALRYDPSDDKSNWTVHMQWGNLTLHGREHDEVVERNVPSCDLHKWGLKPP